jgi:hypothetical protein
MRRERAQATIEVVATLPLLFAVAVLGLQALVWGAAAVEASAAASAGARAAARGGDVAAAVRSALPGVLRDGVVSDVRVDGVHVRLVAPRLAPFLPRLRLSAVER